MKSNENNSELVNNTIVEILDKKLKTKEYQRSRLLFRTERTILKLEKIESAITLIKKKKNDLSIAINAIEDGELKEQLKIQKVKVEYKLFLLQIRKNKVNVIKIIINQSKLNELDVTVLNLKSSIYKVELQFMVNENNSSFIKLVKGNTLQINNVDTNNKLIISINLPDKNLKINKSRINAHLKVAS